MFRAADIQIHLVPIISFFFRYKCLFVVEDPCILKYQEDPAQPGMVLYSILSPSKAFQSSRLARAKGGSPSLVGKYLSISGSVTGKASSETK